MTDPAARQQLLDWDRRHYWHAFTQMAEYEPLVVEQATGARLIDIDGNEYLDGVASMWCNVHGHSHPVINRAVAEQLERLPHCTSLGMSNPPAIRLAHRLAELAPGNLEHVFYGSDGSSAIEVALKMAFQYWQQCAEPRQEKTRYIAYGQAYHGDTLGSASVGGIDRFHALFEPLLFDVIRLPSPNPRLVPADVAASDAANYYLAQLEAALEQHGPQVAALVIEPMVQCAAGIVMHPPGYLRGVRELTKKHDVLLIADEVAVGCGRTGKMFASEHEDVVPDFLCLGKGLTGGYLPLSATVTHTEIYSAFLGEFAAMRTLFHGHTFGGNALGAAAALAALRLFDEEATLATMAAKIQRLGEHLCRIAEGPHVAHPRQLGMIGALDLVADRATARAYPPAERRGFHVGREALARGVWIRPLGDVVYVMPPLAITMDELDRLMETVAEAIDAVTAD